MQGLLLLLVANDRPLINVDITLLLNIGLWVALFFFLKATFWTPMLDLLAAREEGTEGQRRDATRLGGEAKQLRGDLEDKLRGARESASRQREALRAEGTKAESDLLEKVRSEVGASVEKQKAEIAVQREKVRSEILATVPALAAEMAARVLRREVKS